MPASRTLTLRLNDASDIRAVERIQAVTQEATASRSLVRAAHLYPDTLEALNATREHLARVRDEHAALRRLAADWMEAASHESTARTALARALE